MINSRKMNLFHYFSYKNETYQINVEKMLVEKIKSVSANMPGLGDFNRQESVVKNPGILTTQKKSDVELTEKTVPIVNAAFFLTQTCNLECVYCYGESGRYGTGGQMDEKTAFRAVDWLIEKSLEQKWIHIGFFGGEPFLNFSLMKTITKYAKEKCRKYNKEVDFHTTTNATLLDEEKISFIVKHDITVMVSIDGPEDLHDKQRPFSNGKGSYHLVEYNCKKLISAVPDIIAHAVILGDTDPIMVKDYLLNFGFCGITLTPASNSLFSNEKNLRQVTRYAKLMRADIEGEADNWIIFVQKKDKKNLMKIKMESRLYLAIMALLHNSRKKHSCGAGLGLVGISSTGDIYLCHRFTGIEEYKLGSVNDNHFDLSKYTQPVTCIEPCSRCFAQYYCAGGCKHDNAGACGSIYSPSKIFCRERCLELELAAYVVGNLDNEDKAFLVKEEIFPPKPCLFDF